MYGLIDASLMWFKRVRKFVDENNGTSSIMDTAIFMWHHNDKLIGVMTVRVDDFLCAGTDLFYLNIISKLTLREMCPNTEFFLVRIFPHPDRIRRDTNYIQIFRW